MSSRSGSLLVKVSPFMEPFSTPRVVISSAAGVLLRIGGVTEVTAKGRMPTSIKTHLRAGLDHQAAHGSKHSKARTVKIPIVIDLASSGGRFKLVRCTALQIARDAFEAAQRPTHEQTSVAPHTRDVSGWVEVVKR